MKNRPLGALGGVLGPSWPQESTKSEICCEKLIRWTPLAPPVGAQNPSKIGPKSDPKCHHFWDLLEDRFLKPFGANLAQLGPQTHPKWRQVGTKIDPSWDVDLTVVLEWILAPFVLNVNLNMLRAK